MTSHSRGTRELHSRGMSGFTQSKNAWVYTVEERARLHSRGTRGFAQSRKAWVFTVAESVGLHSR